MKRCIRCKQDLDESEFGKCKSYKDGLTYDCLKCRKIHFADYYSKNPDKKKQKYEKQLANHRKHQKTINEKGRKKWRERRELCLNHYGGKCACCGEIRYEFLAIDHINGGGNQERKNYSRNGFVSFLIKNNFPEGYRVLCHNCNLAIGFYGYCPHTIEEQKDK